MAQGQVKKLIGDKGFGFITPEGGDKDLFFHTKDCSAGVFDSLHEGDNVTYEEATSPKGPKAINVQPA